MIFGNAKIYAGSGTQKVQPYTPPAFPAFVQFPAAFLSSLNIVSDGTGTPNPPLTSPGTVALWDGKLYQNPVGFTFGSTNLTAFSSRFTPGGAGFRLNNFTNIALNYFDLNLNGSSQWVIVWNMFQASDSNPYFNSGGGIPIAGPGSMTSNTDPRSFAWTLTNLAGAFGGSGLSTNKLNVPFSFQ